MGGSVRGLRPVCERMNSSLVLDDLPLPFQPRFPAFQSNELRMCSLEGPVALRGGRGDFEDLRGFGNPEADENVGKEFRGGVTISLLGGIEQPGDPVHAEKKMERAKGFEPSTFTLAR